MLWYNSMFHYRCTKNYSAWQWFYQRLKTNKPKPCFDTILCSTIVTQRITQHNNGFTNYQLPKTNKPMPYFDTILCSTIVTQRITTNDHYLYHVCNQIVGVLSHLGEGGVCWQVRGNRDLKFKILDLNWIW